MGVILPFEPVRKNRTINFHGAPDDVDMIVAAQALHAAVRDGRDRYTMLVDARPLIDLMSTRYRFTVMQDGLPDEAEDLATEVLTLSNTLRLLDLDLEGRRPCWNFGVYFCQPDLAWIDDDYGAMSGLAVPLGTSASALARFVRHRIRCCWGLSDLG